MMKKANEREQLLRAIQKERSEIDKLKVSIEELKVETEPYDQDEQLDEDTSASSDTERNHWKSK